MGTHSKRPSRKLVNVIQAGSITDIVPVLGGLNLWYSLRNSTKARRYKAIRPLSVCGLAMKGLRRTIAPTAGLVGVLSLTWIAFQQERFDLTGALKSCRPTEGWLSIESSYAAYSSGSARCLPGKSLARIEKEIDEKITTAPSAEAFSDLGRLKLAANQPEEAAVALEEASRRAPNDPKVWNDLAVAYIATASQGQPANLARAIASAQRAIDLNGALAAPRFNFALALELLYPTELAIAAWEEFLLAAKDSEWVEEASTRLARLREPSSRELWAKARSRLDQGSFASDLEDLNELAARFPQQVRVYVEETLLPRWGERALDGQTTDAADLVQIAKQLGESLAKRGGDHMVADALAAINRAQSSPGALQALAAGHRDFGQGLAAYGNAEIQKAAELLRSSAAEFRRGESPFVHWAEYYLAVCLFQRSDYPAVQRSLEPLVAEGTANRYPNLAGKALWLRGLTHVVQSELTDSLANYLRARELFARTGEAENLAVVHNLLSENFGYLGDSRVRWEHLHRALAAAREVQTPRRIHLLAREAGDACLLLGEPSVALLFEEAALRALPADDAVGRAIALLKLSRIHLGLGKEANALAVLDDAMQEIQQIPAPELRESLRGDVLLAKGSLASGKDLILAGDSFDEALEIYRRTRYWRQVPKLLLKRALVDLGQGQEDLAAANLKGAVQEIERQRADFSDETSRVTFMDSLHDVFDRWVQLDVERGAFDRAFDHAEQGRARALLDVVGRQGEGSTVSGPLTLTEIQRSLPERTAVVVYDVLPDRWIAWVVRRNGVHFVQSDTPEAALDRMVDRFRTALQRENAGRTVDEASQTLSRELLLPLAGFLSGAELLVFVPDKSFHRLPFAALRDPGSGRFLVEVYAVAKAPSATIYVETLERARRLRSLQRPNLLVVGDPAFDPADFPYLDSLQFARSEAARIAALYPEVFSLTGEAATKEAFTAAAGLHDIVHFAGHGIPNYKTPRRAGLLFAPGSRSGASPLLSVAEIESMQLPRTRLVILSACSSSDGGISVGEGVLGLARSFLAAGVPTVLGSLWDVKDKETTDFMVFFHERLREGNDPLAAFREAQRAALARTGTSGLWAAFEIIGGVEPLHLGARP